MRLTWSHAWGALTRRKPMSVEDKRYFGETTGLVTIKYPQEHIPVPDVGRYHLVLDEEDCIGCDQCARVCPVNCIEIETIRSVEDLGLTSDGTKKKLYLAKFNIDLAKCCFCGLCTVVCPTECLYMEKDYDYSEENVEAFTGHYGMLTPEEIIEKHKAWAAYEEAKRLAKEQAKQSSQPTTETTASAESKPVVKPKMKIVPKKVD